MALLFKEAISPQPELLWTNPALNTSERAYACTSVQRAHYNPDFLFITFNMSKMVFMTMRSMMKFSKGGEVTSLQMWNRQPDCSSGTYTCMGLAWIT